MQYEGNCILNSNTIVFEFNQPEEGGIAENFDYFSKQAYMTQGVSSLMKVDKEIEKSYLLSVIFQRVKAVADKQKLDYLQKLTVNEQKCWIIDNGDTICLLTPDEY